MPKAGGWFCLHLLLCSLWAILFSLPSSPPSAPQPCSHSLQHGLWDLGLCSHPCSWGACPSFLAEGGSAQCPVTPPDVTAGPVPANIEMVSPPFQPLHSLTSHPPRLEGPATSSWATPFLTTTSLHPPTPCLLSLNLPDLSPFSIPHSTHTSSLTSEHHSSSHHTFAHPPLRLCSPSCVSVWDPLSPSQWTGGGQAHASRHHHMHACGPTRPLLLKDGSHFPPLSPDPWAAQADDMLPVSLGTGAVGREPLRPLAWDLESVSLIPWGPWRDAHLLRQRPCSCSRTVRSSPATVCLIWFPCFRSLSVPILFTPASPSWWGYEFIQFGSYMIFRYENVNALGPEVWDILFSSGRHCVLFNLGVIIKMLQ